MLRLDYRTIIFRDHHPGLMGDGLLSSTKKNATCGVRAEQPAQLAEKHDIFLLKLNTHLLVSCISSAAFCSVSGRFAALLLLLPLLLFLLLLFWQLAGFVVQVHAK